MGLKNLIKSELTALGNRMDAEYQKKQAELDEALPGMIEKAVKAYLDENLERILNERS